MSTGSPPAIQRSGTSVSSAVGPSMAVRQWRALAPSMSSRPTSSATGGWSGRTTATATGPSTVSWLRPSRPIRVGRRVAIQRPSVKRQASSPTRV